MKFVPDLSFFVLKYRIMRWDKQDNWNRDWNEKNSQQRLGRVGDSLKFTFVELRKPLAPTESVEPAWPAEQVEVAEPVEPAEPAQPAEPVQPAQPVKPAWPAESAEPAEPKAFRKKDIKRIKWKLKKPLHCLKYRFLI